MFCVSRFSQVGAHWYNSVQKYQKYQGTEKGRGLSSIKMSLGSKLKLQERGLT